MSLEELANSKLQGKAPARVSSHIGMSSARKISSTPADEGVRVAIETLSQVSPMSYRGYVLTRDEIIAMRSILIEK